MRTPRPVERRAAPRTEPAYRQPEEKEEPRVVHRAATPRHVVKEEKSVWKRLMWPVIAAVIVILAGAGWFAWSNMNGGSAAIDGSKYQAVFFTNGQVYFGKLHAFNAQYMKLTDIYYLQTKSDKETDPKNPQQTATSQNGVQLIKLGEEIHGPEDEMIISKDQLLFYENLKPDGKVAQSIEKYKK